MLNRRALLGGIAASALVPEAAKAAFATFETFAPPSGASFAPLPIGGGGDVTCMDIASDGTMVVRVDVFGAFLNNTASLGNWQPLLTTSSMPSSLWGFSGGDAGGTYTDMSGGVGGVYEIKIAHTNTNVMYMLWKGLMLVTTNKGVNWTQMTNFPAITYLDPNGEPASNGVNRWSQKKMAIDPANVDVVYIFTPQNGLYVSSNGTSGSSATFTHVTSVVVPTITTSTFGASCGVAFDTTSAVTGGKTQHIICTSFGQNVYETTNGGTTWAVAGSGGPTTCIDGVFSGGAYYCATQTAAVEIYSGGTWTAASTGNPGTALNALAISPTNPDWIIGWGGGNNPAAQYNWGVISGTSITWCGPDFTFLFGSTSSPSEPQWLGATRPNVSSTFWAGTSVFFDPVVANRVWLSWGYGVSYLDTNFNIGSPSCVYAPTAATTWSLGIENMVSQDIISQPGFDLLVGVEDNQIFQIQSLTTAPTATSPSVGNREFNQAAWSMDASQSVSGLVAVLCSGEGLNADNYSSFSTNGGATWTLFTGTLPTGGLGNGAITCAGSGQFCMIPEGSSVAPSFYTGSTWSASTGAPTGQYIAGNFSQSKFLVNDAAGSMYLMTESSGLYKSTNGGQTWSQIDSANHVTGFPAILKTVPGNAQFLFYSQGYGNGGSGASYPTGQPFYKRTSDGGGWSSVANVNDVFMYGFGQIYSGFTLPTLWLMGFVNKGGAGYKWGLWRSRDLGASDWTWITDWPAGNFDRPTCMSGDMNDYTKVYIGYDDTSFAYGTGIA